MSRIIASLLFLTIFSSISVSRSSPTTDLFPTDFKVFTLQGDSLQIKEYFSNSNDRIIILVFLALPVCHQCCVDLNTIFHQILKTDKNIAIFGIISSENSIVDKRLSLIYFRKYFGKYMDYFFIYNLSKPLKIGTIEIYNFVINGTPALFLFNKKGSLYLSFDKLFKKEKINYSKLKGIIKNF